MSRTKKPKYETRIKKEKFETCFKMTQTRDTYDGYPLMPPMTADNQEELNEKVNEYLKELIEFINEPLIECKCCKGRGIINIKTWEEYQKSKDLN